MCSKSIYQRYKFKASASAEVSYNTTELVVTFQMASTSSMRLARGHVDQSVDNIIMAAGSSGAAAHTLF